MLKRLKYIFTTLLLIAAIQAAGQTYVIDKVCIGSTGHYRIDGEENSTYEWLLYDQAGNTISLTNSAGTPFGPVSVSGTDIFGSEITISWTQAGTFELAAIQYSFPLGCDTLQQGIIEVYNQPEVFAGNPITICSESVVALSGATASNTSALAWTTSGDGTVVNGSTLTPTYTPGPNDILAGTVTLTLTGQGMGVSGTCTEAVSTVTITISNLKLTISAIDLLCFEGASGTAKVEVAGAYGVTLFAWTGPNGFSGNQAEITGLAAGTYSVTVSDANGCTATGSITINEPPLLTATAVGTPAKCFAGNDGTATVSASGGTASYTYQWNDPALQNTQTATGLAAGNYIVTVTDANGCTATASVTIGEPTQLIASVTASNVNCFGGNNGSATVSVSGGTVTYTYQWNDPLAQNTQTATGLTSGVYSVTVTDANGCIATVSVTITEPPLLTASTTNTEVKCFGGNDGTATVNVSGGTASYTYLWSDPVAQTTATATGLNIGIYNVKVTDALGCTVTASVTITQPPVLTASASGTPANCYNGADGSATVSVSGGTASYTYLWSDPLAQTTSTATGLAAGTYTVTVTDQNLCLTTASVTITQPTPIVIAEIHIDSKCSGSKPGSIDLTVSGGTPGYTYLWSAANGFTATTEDISNLAGTESYTVTVTDANGCTASSNIYIDEEKNMTIAETHDDVKCFGDASGSIDINVNGGKKPLLYSWFNLNDLGTVIATTEDVSNLLAGVYRITVTDANECTETLEITITEPQKLLASVTGTNVKCFAGNDGTAIVSVTGGAVPYSYLWNDPLSQSTPTATGLKTGIYSVTVTDANGCSASASVTITEPTQLSASATGISVKCFGGNDGSATVTASGGTATYTYLWNDLAAQKTPTATGLIAGTYQVNVTDANGCTVSASGTITQPANALTASAIATNVKCFGGNDGTASSTTSGGTAPYSYLWTDPAAQTTPIANNLIAGTYNLTVTDANGCTTSLSVTITQPTELTATVSGSDAKCFGASDGSATVAPVGGTLPYTYLWNDAAAQTTPTATGLPAGTYQVRVTDANGCTFTATYTISQPSAPLTASATGTDAKCFVSNDGSATVTASGGTAPYSYLWNDPATQTTQSAVGLLAGIYSVTVTDVNGCSSSASVTIGQPTPLAATISGTDLKCFGATDGTASVTVTGGTIPYTYQWNDLLAQTTQTAVGLGAGLYKVTIIDANGCSVTSTITLNEPAASLTVFVVGKNVSCFGGNDGTATATISGGTAPYTYLWNDALAQTSQNASGLIAGTYKLIVTDANDCTASASVTITEPTQLVATISGTDVKCFGGNDGTATILASGGTLPYAYLWNDPAAQSASTANGLKIGTYQVTVTDANGCTISATITINQPTLLTASVSKTDVNCFGGNDGTATVSAVGGTVSYTYLWNDALAQTTSTANNLKAGNYQVTVTDANGCTVSSSVTINEPSNALTALISSSDVKCFGGNDGTAAVSVSGGTASYTYLWSDSSAQTTSTANGLKAGIYQVVVTDANGCTTSASVTINEPLLLTATITGTNVKCMGGSDGQAVVSVSGGTTNYTYLWNDLAAQTSSTATGLKAGVYQVVVTDAHGCTATASVTITEPPLLTASISGTDVKCFGGNDGTATVSVSGGTASYTYLWNDTANQTTATASGLKAGTYQVNVTDANGCATSATVTITEPTQLTATISGTDVKCFGGNDGSATVSAAGGTVSYTYLWNDALAQTTSTANNLKAGNYQVTVTDANGCAVTSSITINEPSNALTALISSSDVKCFGGNDGTAAVSVSGGTASYTYSWNDPATQTTSTASGLKAGIYQVIVTDANGCTTSASVTITEPLLLTASITGTNVKCMGGSDGQAVVSVSGGTTNYTYLWNDPANQTSPTATGLKAGVYQVVVTDAHGCTATASVTITEPPLLTASVLGTDIKCFGGNDGTATVSVSGGTASYTYLWNDPAAQTSATATGLKAGTYQVVVTDANGCNTDVSITLTQPALALTASVTGINVKCFGGNDGSATVSVSGGTASYTYLWNDALAQTTPVATGLRAGVYQVVVTDANGCLVSSTITITEPAAGLILSITDTSVKCFGGNDGSATASVSGGTIPYTYLWNDPAAQTTSIASGLKAGVYLLIVTDSNGCTTSASVTIKEPAAPLTAAASGTDVKCFGGSDGTVTVLASGGTTAYSYLWNDPAAQTSATATGLKAGTYQVAVTDANGCTTSDSVTISEPALLSLTIAGTPVKCFGGNDGTATVSAIGGTAPFTYLWDDAAAQTTSTATGLIAGNYKVTVTDANNCSISTSITILQPALPLTASAIGTAVKCFGGNDGTATVSVSGGTATYTYQWNDPAVQTTTLAVGLTAGTYQVLVTDANGCTTTATVTIVEPAASLAATVSGTNVKCFGGNDGKATVSVSGGTPAFTYLWNDAAAQTGATATGLIAGNYRVVVTDGNGCATSATVSISQPATIPTSTTNLTVCQNLLPFKWNGNDYAAGGTYSVTLTTKIGCDSIAVLNLQIEIPKVPVFAAIGPLCKNSVAPALPLSSTNGFAGTWSPSVISTTVAGTITYTFTPASGQCATTATITIEVIDPVVPQFAAIGPLCKNTIAPVLPAISLNGIPGTWSPAIISTGTVGTTTYTFTPNIGQCATTAAISIEVTEPLAFAGLPETICPDSPYTLAGATAQYYSTLLWTTSGDGKFDDATKLKPVYTPGAGDMSLGTVTLTITAQGSGTGLGCLSAVSSVTLTIVRINASVAPSDVTCYGANDGTIIITDFSGGSGNYEYRVDGFGWQIKSQYLNLAPGLYKVEMRDLLIPACVRELANITIVQPDPLSATAEPQDATCLGNDGTISIINPDGGSGSYEYSMNGGAWTTSGYFAGLVPGNYLIEMRDLNVPDCQENLGSVTIAMPIPITAKVDKKDVSCYSGSDGQITITEPKNGSGLYEFSIGAGWSSQMVFSDLTAGSYSVQMRDFNAKACVQGIGSVTIGEPAPLNATLSHKNISCFGSKDGSIAIENPVGGSGSFEFTIDGTTWANTTSYTNLGPGTYYVLMRDKNAPACVVSFTAIDIVEPLPLTAAVTSDNISCFGAHDGRITITNPQNGTPGYEYTIDGSNWGTATTFSGLGTNTYTVQMRDSKGCKETIAVVFIVEPKPLTAFVEHTNATCLGNDGTITITNPENSVSGLYEFSIDGGSVWTSAGLFTGLSSNTYTVRIRDSKLISCERTIHTAIITEPVPLLATADKTDVTCFGANDGIISVKNPNGGSGLYEYSVDGTTWTNTTTLANLSPAVYTLQMRDAKAIICEIQIGTYTITQPDQLVATASPTDVTCYGGKDGFISFSVASGGSGSFEYSVNGIDWFTSKIDNLKANTYTVQMRDADVKSCVVSLGLVEIKEPAKITADVKPTMVTCFGANDGTITISNPQNGIPPYQYSLNGVAPWQSSNVFTGVKPGTYDLIVVSDANNCVSTLAIVTITEPEKLEAKATSTNETTPGANDGTITITSQKGGSGTFDYSKDGIIWQPGDTFTGLAPATYTILVRDANSITCTIPLTVNILPAGSITAKYVHSDVICFGDLTGSITFNSPNGATNYQFSVDGGASWGLVNQLVFSGLAAQQYTLVVRDADNTANANTLATIEITQPDQIEAVVTATSETFAGAKDGAITISSPKGGSGAYDYSIDGINWQASEQFPGLSTGIYNVQIRDRNAPSCVIPYPKVIQPAGALIADVTHANVLCNGGNTGSILFSNASGATVIEYSVDNGATWNKTGVFNGLTAGDYDVMIQDANNNANRVSLGKVIVTEPMQKLMARMDNYSPPLCAGSSGSVSINAMGGTPPYSGIGDFNIPAGITRHFIIVDKNGCTAIIDIPMPDPPKIVASAVINSAKCFGENGTVVISATGGTGALKGTGTFIVQAGKAYSFKVTDANGCSSNIISGIMPPTEMLTVVITPVSSLCLGGSATVTVSATGGIPPYITGIGTYTIALGTHTFTVTDSSGCSAVGSINISPKDPPAAPVLVVSVQPNCIVNTGTIEVTSPLGANYQYRLDGGTYTSATTFDKLLPGSTHAVQVKDISTGCESGLTSITVDPLPDLPLAPVVSVTQPGCIVATGKIEVTEPKAGTGFEYRFDGGTYTSATTISNVLPGSTHNITIRDLLTGCVSAPAIITIDLMPTNPATPSATVTVNPTCNNPNGTVTVVSPINSGGKTYAYSINGIDYQPSPVFGTLTGTTTYTITVRDIQSGCTSSPTAIYVPAIPPSPVITVSSISPNCNGETFTITINVPPVVSAGKTYNFDGIYTFNYDGGKFDNVVIKGGTATITGLLNASKDFNNIQFEANGCPSTGTNTNVKIIVPDAIVITQADVKENTIKGTQRGAVDLTVTGGSPKLSYVWVSNTFTSTITTEDLNNVADGTYTVTITDANGCNIVKSIKIPLNNPPVAVADKYLYLCAPITGDLLVNDYDPDPKDQNDFITVNTVPVVSPKHFKTFKINNDGTFSYEVLAGYSGTDVFVYEIADKFGQTATATVTIDVVSDFDGDGIPDLADADADADGILNVDEVAKGGNWKIADSDGDGHFNWLDIDDDNDGIVDNVEAQSTSGYIVPSGKINKDGVDLAYDLTQGGTKIVPVDTDSTLADPDGVPDFLDVDSDNDWVPDYIEGHDLNADGKPDRILGGKDTDADGLDEIYDIVVNGCNNGNSTGSNSPLQDFDGDGMKDWRDDNDDDDEYLTRFEDLNADGDYSNDVTGHVGHPEYLWYGRDCELFIPDAFSPNDDNIHDYFQIYCIESYPNAKMYIFDQVGNKLYERENYGNLAVWKTPEQAWWDGTTTNRSATRNGNKVVPGTYYYVLRLGNGEVKKSFVFVSY